MLSEGWHVSWSNSRIITQTDRKLNKDLNLRNGIKWFKPRYNVQNVADLVAKAPKSFKYLITSSLCSHSVWNQPIRRPRRLWPLPPTTSWPLGPRPESAPKRWRHQAPPSRSSSMAWMMMNPRSPTEPSYPGTHLITMVTESKKDFVLNLTACSPAAGAQLKEKKTSSLRILNRVKSF